MDLIHYIKLVGTLITSLLFIFLHPLSNLLDRCHDQISSNVSHCIQNFLLFDHQCKSVLHLESLKPVKCIATHYICTWLVFCSITLGNLAQQKEQLLLLGIGEDE